MGWMELKDPMRAWDLLQRSFANISEPFKASLGPRWREWGPSPTLAVPPDRVLPGAGAVGSGGPESPGVPALIAWLCRCGRRTQTGLAP